MRSSKQSHTEPINDNDKKTTSDKDVKLPINPQSKPKAIAISCSYEDIFGKPNPSAKQK